MTKEPGVFTGVPSVFSNRPEWVNCAGVAHAEVVVQAASKSKRDGRRVVFS